VFALHHTLLFQYSTLFPQSANFSLHSSEEINVISAV